MHPSFRSSPHDGSVPPSSIVLPQPCQEFLSLSVIIAFLILRSLFFLSAASVNYIFTRLDRALITTQIIAASNATPEVHTSTTKLDRGNYPFRS